MFNRERVINWWIGRLTDSELADYAGMTTRNLQIVLNVPIVKAEIIGGGRGSKGTRRIPAKVRNAVAMVQALHDAGLTLELAAQMIGTFWYLPDAVNRAIDFIPADPANMGISSLLTMYPKGGFLPTDSVPAHIVSHYVVPCRSKDNPNPSDRDVICIDAKEWKPDPTTGRMFYDSQDLAPLTAGPIYQGEHDPTGFLLPSNTLTEAMPWDDRLEIINGHWIFHRSPEPDGFETLSRIFYGGGDGANLPDYTFTLIGEITDSRKSVQPLSWDADDIDITTEKADFERKNFHSKLGVNLSLPVRRMKRRAFGLVVDGNAPVHMAWADMQVSEIPQPTETSTADGEKEDPLRRRTKDEAGNRVLVGLTKHETDFYDDYVEKRLSSHKSDNKDTEKYLSLHNKHETERFKNIEEERLKKGERGS